MKNLFKIILLSFLLFPITLQAQSDFRVGSIILLEGDTIHGLIDYQSDNKLCENCRFKITSHEGVKKYYPWELKGFLFEKEQRKFISDSVFINGYKETYFLEVVVEGKLSLYNIVSSGSRVLFFLKERGNPLLIYLPFEKKLVDVSYKDRRYSSHKLEWYISNNHIDTLKKYTSDAPAVFSAIDRIKEPTIENLKILLKTYHDLICEKSLCVTYVKIKTPPIFFISAGVTYSSLVNDISSSNDVIIGGKLFFSGILGSMSILNGNERIFLKSGILLARNDNYILTNSKDISRKKLFFKVPLLVEYRFPFKIFQPILEYGYNYNSLYALPSMTFAPGLNLNLSKNIDLQFIPELECQPFEYFFVIPKKILSYNLFIGLKFKL